MREIVLKKFFEGEADSETLASDLVGTIETSGTSSHYRIEDMDGEFEITGKHLVSLCDAVIEGKLDPSQLETIGFCLVASDAFHWDTDVGDGEIIAQTCFDWSEPRINFALTLDNVKKFRERLIIGKNVFVTP